MTYYKDLSESDLMFIDKYENSKLTVYKNDEIYKVFYPPYSHMPVSLEYCIYKLGYEPSREFWEKSSYRYTNNPKTFELDLEDVEKYCEPKDAIRSIYYCVYKSEGSTPLYISKNIEDCWKYMRNNYKDRISISSITLTPIKYKEFCEDI